MWFGLDHALSAFARRSGASVLSIRWTQIRFALKYVKREAKGEDVKSTPICVVILGVHIRKCSPYRYKSFCHWHHRKSRRHCHQRKSLCHVAATSMPPLGALPSALSFKISLQVPTGCIRSQPPFPLPSPLHDVVSFMSFFLFCLFLFSLFRKLLY